MATPEQTTKEVAGSKRQTQANEAGKEASVIIQKPKENRMAESAADKYRKALEAAEAIKNSAVDELKGGIFKQIEELNTFGFSFRLTEDVGKAPAKKSTGTPRAKSEICGVCHFTTNPLHDGRHKLHKAQETKKPLTDKQLADNGLTKVA